MTPTGTSGSDEEAKVRACRHIIGSQDDLP